jgi:hypothetical protein
MTASPVSGSRTQTTAANRNDCGRRAVITRIGGHADTSRRPAFPPHYGSRYHHEDDSKTEEEVERCVPKAKIALMECDAHGHGLAGRAVVGKAHFGEDLAGILIDVDGTVAGGIVRVAVHGIGRNRVDALLADWNVDAELPVETDLACESSDAIEIDRYFCRHAVDTGL